VAERTAERAVADRRAISFETHVAVQLPDQKARRVDVVLYEVPVGVSRLLVCYCTGTPLYQVAYLPGMVEPTCWTGTVPSAHLGLTHSIWAIFLRRGNHLL
jgi:hypothetical protein